jgi:hypothetical protein
VIVTKSISSRISTLKKIARICISIFFILTVIIVILSALGTFIALGFFVGDPVTVLWYFWAGSLTVHFILYAFIATNQPKEV